MQDNDKKNLSNHFAFGDNWSKYSRFVTTEHLDAAKDNLIRLLGVSDLDGKSFCDVGCGSGIHSVAAALMGARVTAIDIDPLSVQTTNAMAEKFGVRESIMTKNESIFDHSLNPSGYDIVYSWGVLHHTGDMWNAIHKSIKLLSREQGSIFAIALYRKTRLCNFWRVEKRIYMKSPSYLQSSVRTVMGLMIDLANVVRLRNPVKYRKEYRSLRGMSRKHDIHDWLGGYPYESVEEVELINFFAARGFSIKQKFVLSPGKVRLGIFGSGCDEYVFHRSDV